MFKRIVKIFSLVCLGAVVFVGCVAGVLAIRGDFKVKKIKPTSIAFEIPEMDLVYDADVSGEEKTYPSFTISAQPADVTETKCVITVSDPNLITFKKFVDGEWVDYNSSVFYLNQKIYFEINNIESNHVNDDGTDNYYNEENPTTDYVDGVLTITVKDSSGLLQTSMTMEIDRNVTSISFKDTGNANNNKIKNGKFLYEQNVVENEEVVQKIDAIINQDYELNVITAPLMSLKPFANKDEKIYEIYYMEAGTPKLLTHENDKVKLKFETNNEYIFEDCNFLRFDEEKGIYILNSAEAKQYDFKLAVYENYEIQQEYAENNDLTLSERLTHMLQKNVSIVVSGTDVQNIEFRANSNSFDLSLFKDNSLVLNDANQNVFNLGLTLTKNNADNTSETEITGRFNEVAFLDETSFKNQIIWNLKVKEVLGIGEDEEKITADRNIIITMYGEYPNKKAKISGLSVINGLAEINDTVEFNVTLTYSSTAKVFTLLFEKEIENTNGTGDKNKYTIEFKLRPDISNSHLLNLVKLENNKYMTIKCNGDDIAGYDDINYNPITDNIGDRLIYTQFDSSTNSANFKALNSGVYLVFLDENLNNINNKFKTTIEYKNGKDNIITIKPLDSDLTSIDKAKNLYAIVVNADGQYAYTDNEGFLRVNINYDTTEIYVTTENQVGLPITVTNEKIDYNTELEVIDFVGTKNGSYADVGALLFAPKYYYDKLVLEPTDWAYNWKSYYNADYELLTDDTAPIFANGVYYEKIYNNYMFIDSVRYTYNNVEYFLLGRINSAGKFENKIIATDLNKKSILYPLVPQTKYLTGYDRVQTASEYVDDLLNASNTLSDFVDIGVNNWVIEGENSTQTNKEVRICYDTTLFVGRKLYKYVFDVDNSAWLKEGNFYNIQEIGYDGVNILITAVQINENGIETDIIEQFAIAKDVHAENVNDKIKVNPIIFTASESLKSKQLTTYTYYNLKNMDKIEAGFNGEHFEILNNKDDNNNYYVIKDYLNIDESLKVPEDETKSLKNMQANVYLNFNWNLLKQNEKILQDINKNLTISIYEYNASGIKVNTISKDDLFTGGLNLTQSHIKLTDIYQSIPNYDNTLVYAKYNEDTFIEIYSGTSAPDDWETNWSNYRVVIYNGLSAVINPTFDLDEGHFVKIELKYSMGSYSISWTTPKLYIKSRNVQQYSVSLGKNAYSATLLTSDSAPSDWTDLTQKYYKLENYTYVEIDRSGDVDKDYKPNTYYILNNENVYTGVINYQMVVGYDTNTKSYTYTVYAKDEQGKYLYSIEEDGAILTISTDANNAFKAKNDGGWIDFAPFYANNTNYSITTNDYIRFEGTNVVDASESEGYQPVVIKNNLVGTSLTINVNVETDGNFNFENFNKIDSNDKVATISPNYTYNGNTNNIASLLDAKITDASTYIKESDTKWVNPNNTNDYITLIKNENGTWTVARTLYVNTIVKIDFTSKIGTKQCVVEFSNPYEVSRSTANSTNELYSGTTFEFAYYNTSGGHNLDYIYSIINKSIDGSFSIECYNGNTLLGKWDSVANNIIKITIPSVTDKTEVIFKIKYSDEVIDNLEMNILPNLFISNQTADAIELNDCNKGKYNLADDLKLYSYDTNLNYKKYAKYVETAFASGVFEYVDGEYVETQDTSAQTGKTYYKYAWIENVDATKTYEGDTYLDEKCTQLYKTNIVAISDNILSVDKPINEIGTYYVKVDIKADGLIAGTIKFKVEALSNIEGEDILITASQNKVFTLEDINNYFNLVRNGDKYIGTSTYVDGKTYKKDGENYVLLQADDASGEYYIKVGEITDLLWLEYNNDNLEVSYEYAGTTLKQTKNSLIYNSVEYEFIGNSYNWSNYIYNKTINGSIKVVDTAGSEIAFVSIGNNIIYNNVAGLSIYCANNAYLFKNENTVIAISVETDGKYLYVFDLSSNSMTSSVGLSNLQELILTYNGFGSTTASNENIVDEITYNAQFIVNMDGVKHNISPISSYNIKVAPYTLNTNREAILIAGVESVLFDESDASNGLFRKDTNIKNVAFGTNADLNLVHYGTQYNVTPLANGNSYTTNLRITLTYSDDTIYSYYKEILIYNQQVVNIVYPYQTDNAIFNSNLTELLVDANTSLEYNTTDLENWLNKNTFQFDLALKGDVVNLVNDELLNIQRFETYQRLTSNTTYEKGKYYTYTNNKYVLLTGAEPANWNEYWNYYTNKANPTPAKIELVAVSGSLSNVLTQVKNDLTINNGRIAISSSFEYNGYLAFKVYINNNDASAYGYYIIRVVDDDNFNMVRNIEAGRNTQLLSKQITADATNEEKQILNVIRNSGYDISVVANISNYLIENENIYLFALNNFKDANGNLHYTWQLIPQNTPLSSQISTQNVEVAVVMAYGTSLVHLCNYEIVLQSTIVATTGADIENIIDENYHIYNAKSIQYKYSTSTNEYDLNNYLTFKENGSNLVLQSINAVSDVVVGGNNLSISSNITINGNIIQYNGITIATISGTKLILNKAISTNEYFYLRLSYNKGFEAYVKINIDAYSEFKAENVIIDVGMYTGDKFANTYDLSKLIGTYSGGCDITYSSNNVEFATTNDKVAFDGAVFTFTQTENIQTVYIKIVLNDIANPITKIYTIKIAVGITEPAYNDYDNGKTLDNPIIADKNTTFDENGSLLKVEINGSILTIKSSDGNKDYVTIYTSENIKSVAFNLKGAQDNEVYDNYIVSGNVLDTNGTIYFVHSATNISFRLGITISTNNLTYSEKTVYVQIPKTYELTSVYRVCAEDDTTKTATYETVIVGSELLVKTDDSKQQLDNNLFGGSTNRVIENVNPSRFAIIFGDGNTYYGYDNFIKLGLYDENNPNKLGLTFSISGDLDSAEFINDKLIFKNVGTVIIKLTNATFEQAIEYKFLVMEAESDYNNISFNYNLETLDDEEYISVTISQLNNNFVLATYPYLVTGVDGQVGWITTNLEQGAGTLSFDIDTSANANKNKIIVKKCENLDAEFNKFTVNIITMNGVAKTITLIVTNYNATYGYGDDGYETLYANTEGYKFTDNISSGEPRMTLINGKEGETYNILTYYDEKKGTTSQNTNYVFEWAGIVNTIITSISSTTKLNASGLAVYDTSTNTFKLKSVANTSYVTMVFNVKYSDYINSDYIIGKALYSLCIENDIYIGMNGLEKNESVIDLYLGTYKRENYNGKYLTSINLLRNENGDGVNFLQNEASNNVFITLERYSDNYTIANNKALYNGSSSYLKFSDVINYLTFNLNNVDESVDAKVNPHGILQIYGNPETSIELIVGSKGVVGYYRTFIINVHPVAIVDTKWDSTRNTSPKQSGTEITLYTSATTISSETAINTQLVKFNNGVTYTSLGDIVVGSNSITNGEATINIGMQMFDINTSITTIKNTADGWIEATIDANGKCTLPQVPFATGENNKYFIISYKVSITIRSETNVYYAHYTVYNNTNITVNDLYLDKNIITYTKGAWQSGDTITIMDASNNGMYTAFKPVTLTEKPTEIDTYYEKDSATGYSVKNWEESDDFEPGVYYILNDIIANIDNFTFTIENLQAKEQGLTTGERDLRDISVSDTTLTATLPESLFNNSANVMFRIKSNGITIYEEEWILKSNDEITPKNTLPLSELFLRSEIGEELYNKEIINIMGTFNETDVINSVNKPDVINSVAKDEGTNITRSNINYIIYKVKYSGNSSGSNVFTNTAEYYMLVGSDVAMGFNYNGGNYYINQIIDESNINNKIYLDRYIKGYFSNQDNEIELASSITDIKITSDDDNIEANGTNSIKLNHKQSNFYVTVNVTASINGTQVTRPIQIYFNFIINAKDFASTDITDTTMQYNEDVISSLNVEMKDVESGSKDITDEQLKAKLLELIYFNEYDISTADYDKFSVTVTKETNAYQITYTYSYLSVTYTRTFTMNTTN